MGFEFSIKFGKQNSETRSLENPNTPITLSEISDTIGNGGRSISGASVTAETALSLTAVYRAVSLISGTIAAFPWHVYRSQINGNIDIDRRHPLYFLLHDEPHPLYGSFKFREAMMSHLLLTDGNFYAIIQRAATNQAVALKIVDPSKVTVVLTTDDQLFYFITGYPEAFPARDIFHVAGFGFDGIKGRRPLQIAREAIGMGLTLQEFGQRFFANGSHLGGVIEHPGKMDKQQYDRFVESWATAYSSVMRSGKTAILEGGAKFNRIGIPPEDAQFLQTKKFSNADIARIFGLPLHMLNEMEGATFSNIEHQGIEMVQYTYLPWCCRIEEEVQRKLVKTNERGYIFNKLNMDGLLRGDNASRAAYLSTMANSGIYTIDEARAYENKNKRGGLADEIRVPLNMGTESQLKSQLETTPK